MRVFVYGIVSNTIGNCLSARVGLNLLFYSSSVGSNRKKASMGTSNSFDILNAVGKLGSNFSFSIALIVCRETPIMSASSSWVSPLAFRNSLTRFFMNSDAYLG